MKINIHFHYIFQKKNMAIMDLLLITEETKSHYVLIKDFNRFMFNQTKHKERKQFCMYCLQCFSSEQILLNHRQNCISINGEQAITMAEKGSRVNFMNFHKRLAVPFVIYADFEASTEKVHGCKPSDNNSYTEAYQKHTDCGYGYRNKVVFCYDDKYSKPVQICRGENAAYKFIGKCLKKLNIVKMLSSTNLTNH